MFTTTGLLHKNMFTLIIEWLLHQSPWAKYQLNLPYRNLDMKSTNCQILHWCTLWQNASVAILQIGRLSRYSIDIHRGQKMGTHTLGLYTDLLHMQQDLAFTYWGLKFLLRFHSRDTAILFQCKEKENLRKN